MNLGEGFQLGDLMGVVRRRALLAGSVAGFTLLTSILVAAMLPNTYVASTTLLVEPQTISSKLVEAGLAESDLNSRLHLMTMQILSRGRLSKIIDDLDLYPEESEEMTREEVISLMRAHIRVEPVLPELEQGQAFGRRQEIEINTFRLIFRGADQRTVAQVANRLANDFIEEHIRERVRVSGDTAEFITSELSRLATQIRSVEDRIASVKNENAGRLPEDLLANQRFLERTLEGYREAQRAHALAESDRAFYAQQVIASAEARPPGQRELSPEHQREQKELMLADLRARGFTDKHPDVIRVQAEIEELEGWLSSRDEDESIELGLSFAEQNALAEQQRAELRVTAAREDVDRLAVEVDEAQQRLIDTPRVAEQLAALEREYQHLFQSYQEYSAKGLEAGVAANMELRQKGEQFRILETAFPPPQPASPNRLVIVLVGLMLGLAAGAGIAILLEALDSSFHTAREVQGTFQLPVLASIPRVVLESDRMRASRQRLLALVVAASLSAVTLVGAGVGYVAVNGAPGFISAILESEDEGEGEPEQG
ncbi:MAG: GumC family protein [Myxococcota bacterium]